MKCIKEIVKMPGSQDIDYTYDAGGNLLRKRQYTGGSLTTTTDYVDGFVYVNSTLSYFPMPEGRIVNNSGTLVQQYIIADPQGNARVSFQDDGGGHPIVVQENSYYGFGLIMPNSPVATPTAPNKQLYNGGSEWQNDYTNLPDYYQTFNRNYDAAIGRFIGVDPAAESAESMTGYQYAGNNPIMNNDPDGDLLSLPGSHLPPYTPWQPLDFGHEGSLGGESLEEWEGQQVSADGGGEGDPSGLLYYEDVIAATGPDVVGHWDTSNGSGVTAAISAIYNMTGQLLGSTAGVDYQNTPSGGLQYSYSTVTTIAAENGIGTGGDYTLHSGTLGDANQGGILDGVPNPASWNFTPAGPGGRYQVAGVSGINFTYFYYGENSKGNIEVGFNHATIKSLYFEYPLIRKTSSGKTYIVPAGLAASFMAASTAAAIEATETAWGRTVPTEGNQEDMYRFFINTLRISVQAGGGRLTESPQYGPTPLTPYRTL